ncbi:MAG: TonB-dependent receptor, partial [Flavobacteriales bacterium]|nr:TonB-dependent receptor [Flavobacteriales bacterium]
MKKISIIIILISILTNSYAQQHTISGYITDKNNGESIIGANIYSKLTGKGVTSNTYGFYSLTVEDGQQEIVYSFIGYKTISKVLNLQENINYDVEFELSSVNIQEVKITGEANIVEKTQTSVIDIPIQQIKTIPALFGEVDVLKAIQLLPGVQSSEGTSGFYVRGGGPDQNLILLDGVPVYNSSHLGGLFSVFNADAIKTVRLTKGGFPARFGGRLSSVLQIDMKEGNMKEFKGDATIGLISSKLTLEGPIIKNKTSFIVSARRTYADLLMKPFLPDNTNFNLYFYDLNAKINHKISNKDRIYLSAYMGDDVFNVDFTGSEDEGGRSGGPKSTENIHQESMNFGLGYGNITSTLRWNHLFNNKLFSNTTLTYSRYQFNTNFALENSNSADTVYNSSLDSLFSGESSENISFGYISGIEDVGARIDFDYIPNPNHDIKFGVSYTHHQFFPGETNLNLSINSPDISQNLSLDTMINFSERTNVHESFLYIEDNVRITNRLKANIGVHIGYYSLDKNTSISEVVDFYEYLANKDNYSIQPRISARYLLNDEWSVKASYSEMKQNIHLLSNSSVGLPSDLWVPAIDSVPSQTSKQWAANVS